LNDFNLVLIYIEFKKKFLQFKKSLQKLLEVFVYLKNKTWRKKMHKTKLLKLLGIFLIVGILGLTGFCKKSEDNNDLALGAGLVVAQQQAEQSAQ
jgi:hypothetical protein